MKKSGHADRPLDRILDRLDNVRPAAMAGARAAQRTMIVALASLSRKATMGVRWSTALPVATSKNWIRRFGGLSTPVLSPAWSVADEREIQEVVGCLALRRARLVSAAGVWAQQRMES